MTERQAINLAILVMTGRYPNLRDVSYASNSYTMLGSRTPANIRAHAQYQELSEALEILKGMVHDDP